MKTTISLPDDLHQRLRVVAATKGVAITAIIEDLVRQYLRVSTPEGVEEQMQGAKSILSATLGGKPIVKEVHLTGTAKGQAPVDAVSKTNVAPSRTNRPLPDFSKAAQVKGKMGR